MNLRLLPSFGLVCVVVMGLGLEVVACGTSPGSEEGVTTSAQDLSSSQGVTYYTCSSTCLDVSGEPSCNTATGCAWSGSCASACDQIPAAECPTTWSEGYEGGVPPACQLIDGVCQAAFACPTGPTSEFTCVNATVMCAWTATGPCEPFVPCPAGFLSSPQECTAGGPTCVPTAHHIVAPPCQKCGAVCC
jgi:hypothetical protein